MPDERRPPDGELEDALRDLGSHVEYPPTPDLSRAVRERIEEDGETSFRRRWTTTPAIRRMVAVAAIILIATAPALSQDVRGSIAGLFDGGAGSAAGAGAAREPSPAAGEDRPQSAASGDLPSSGGGGVAALGQGLGLGERVSPREARPVLLPRAKNLGRPDEIYARGEAVTLIYRASQALPPLGDTGIGLIITGTRDGVEPGYPMTTRVSVNGARGYWAGSGRAIPAPVGGIERLPGGALVWERDGRALRLQARVSKQEAIRLAETVR